MKQKHHYIGDLNRIKGGLFSISIEDLTREQAIRVLSLITEQLDKLDDEDFFGTEGWRHRFGMED